MVGIYIRDIKHIYLRNPRVLSICLAINSLQIGEVLCRYEVEKKLAIEREDYDTAKQKKV